MLHTYGYLSAGDNVVHICSIDRTKAEDWPLTNLLTDFARWKLGLTKAKLLIGCVKALASSMELRLTSWRPSVFGSRRFPPRVSSGQQLAWNSFVGVRAAAQGEEQHMEKHK